jgi:hypothetical protein
MGRSSRPYFIGWTLFLVACGGIYALKEWQNWSWKSRCAAAEAAFDNARRRALAAPSPLPRAFYHSFGSWVRGNGPPPTARLVAELINQSRPLNLAYAGDNGWTGALWTDPATQVMWQLNFVFDRWVGYQQIYYIPSGRPRTPPPYPFFYQEVQLVFEQIDEQGPRICLVAALAALATAPFRRAALLAHISMAVALIWLLARMMPLQRVPWPVYFKTSDLIDRYSPVILMMGLSLIAMCIQHRPRKPRPGAPPTCENCGYDLTGNVSGVCAECGGSLAATISTPGRSSACRTG